VLRPFAEPLLLQVQRDLAEYREARRLLGLLRWFRPASAANVPDNSILREFIGGSILKDFSIWPEGGNIPSGPSRPA
jgi:uridine kinase